MGIIQAFQVQIGAKDQIYMGVTIRGSFLITGQHCRDVHFQTILLLFVLHCRTSLALGWEAAVNLEGIILMYPINPTAIIFRFWLGFMLSFFLFQFIYYHILSISSSPLLGSFPLGMVLSLSGSFTACLSWSDDYIYIYYTRWNQVQVFSSSQVLRHVPWKYLWMIPFICFFSPPTVVLFSHSSRFISIACVCFCSASRTPAWCFIAVRPSARPGQWWEALSFEEFSGSPSEGSFSTLIFQCTNGKYMEIWRNMMKYVIDLLTSEISGPRLFWSQCGG